MVFKGSAIKVLLLLVLTVCILQATTVFELPFFSNNEIKTADLFADILSEKKTTVTFIAKNGEKITQEIVVSGSDSLSHLEDSLSAISVNENEIFIIKSKIDSISTLAHFFEALSFAANRQIRIAYFGDSMIEGDLITSDLRAMLQQKFGGSGVGYVPITSLTAPFRRSIHHTFSANWNSYSFNDKYRKGNPLFFGGYVFNAGYSPITDTVSKSIDSLKLPFVTYNSASTTFDKAFVLNGKSYGKTATALVQNGNNYQPIKLKTDRNFNRTPLYIAGKKNIKTSFILPDSMPIYGFSFESDHGVVLDNYSFRGSNGINLLNVSLGVIREIQDQTPFDLIVLQYGNNVAHEKMSNYGWYQSGLRKVLKRFKAEFPNASILIVGSTDKSYKNPKGKMVTNPGVPFLVETQRKLAAEFGCAFWNLYQDMGGYNSMVGWVDGNAVLANKDYTHLNGAGAKRIAQMLYNRIINSYENAQTQLYEIH